MLDRILGRSQVVHVRGAGKSRHASPHHLPQHAPGRLAPSSSDVHQTPALLNKYNNGMKIHKVKP